MKNKEEYHRYVLDKLIESTEVIYSPKLDYSDSWFFIQYPYQCNPTVIAAFDHPFSLSEFDVYVQDNYGITKEEVPAVWKAYKKYIFGLSNEIERRGPNNVDLVT
jgi:hypothetical protein